MTHDLNGTMVPDTLYNDALAVRRRGGKVFLFKMEYDNSDGIICTNCNGGRHLGLQTVVGGPFDTPQQTRGQGSGNEEDSAPVSMWHNGKWYLANVRSRYRCPVCNVDK